MAGLRQQAIGGMGWSVGARLLKSGVGIVTLAVVSRYLTPAEFGTVALVMFVTGFGQIFVDSGLRTALVQRETITQAQKDTVFWAGMVLAAIVAAVMIVFAEPLAQAFQADAVAPLMRWMAVIFPLAALQSVSMTILERRFAFARIASSDMAAAVSGGVTAMVLVVAGAGITALVAQQIVQAMVSTVVIMAAARFRPRLRFDWTEFRSLISYGGYVMLINIVQFLNTNLDRPIVAGVLSPAVLGYLTMARQIVASPFKIILPISQKVLFPMLSSIQSDKARIAKAYLDVQFATAALMLPATLGVSALAAPIVAVLLGDGWASTVPLMQLVALQMLFVPIGKNNSTVLASLGYAKVQFWWSLMVSSISLTVLWLVVPYGIENALMARLAVSLMAMTCLSLYTLRQIGLPSTALFRILTGPLGAAVVMWLVVTRAEQAMGLQPLAQLVTGVPLGIVVYAAALLLLAWSRTLGTLDMIRRR